MIVLKSQAIKMPTLFSYFISNFSADTKDILDRNKPFAFYHKTLQQYELTREVLSKINEPVESFEDHTHTMAVFERNSKEPYGYQEDAVDFSFKSSSMLINFPQGMGKTLTALKIIDRHKFKRTLIVCGQSNLQEEWLKDADKHDMNRLNIRIVGKDSDCGNAKKIRWLFDFKDTPGVDLINIEALRSVNIACALNDIYYDCIVVDEVQSAKGWSAQQTRGLNELFARAGQFRIALSGTPILNQPLEYFGVLKFLRVFNTSEGRAKDVAKTTFDRYYGDWGFDFWGHYECKGFKNLEELAELILPVLCYVDKSELGLPSKHRRKVNLACVSEELAMLEGIYAKSIKKVKSAGFANKPAVRARMLFLSGTLQSKIDFVLATKEHQLVFSQYTKVLEVYLDRLIAAGKRVLYYHGGLSMEERLAVLRDWSTGKADILLLSVMASRFGLNLTEACITTFVEPPTSLAILEQCEDRAWRIGQTRECQSNLLCGSALDERSLSNILKKQEAIEELKKHFK